MREPTALRVPTTPPMISGLPPACFRDLTVICMPRPMRPMAKSQASHSRKAAMVLELCQAALLAFSIAPLAPASRPGNLAVATRTPS